ncbi:hypothetical protein E4U58_004615 [Claviceps cyperi]|nr:hypothetical protein E4U58_004615 [Claviceps cyperi]
MGDAFHHLRDRDPRRLRFDYIEEIPTLEEEIDEFEAADLGEESNRAYFQELLDAGLGEADYGNPHDLGSRLLDLTANCDAYVGKYSEELPGLLLPTAKDKYWKSLKASTSINLDFRTEASNAEASLNPEQRLLVLTMVEHYERALDGLSPDPLRVNADGRAGTGKSYNVIRHSSYCRGYTQCNVPDFLPRRVGVPSRVLPLPAPRRTVSMAIWTTPTLAFLFKALLSLPGLTNVWQRLQEAYPESGDEYFAGFSIIVAGDVYQLLPASGTALFEPRAKTTSGMASKNAYFALSVTIRSVTLVRQSDTDASSIAFRRVLEDMREGNPDLTDFRTLEPRLPSTLERRERTTFGEQAVYLFATRASVFGMNYLRLRKANALISSKEFNDLTAESLLTVGARVMLMANIWTEAGLVNWSRGYVVDIVWHANVTDPRTTLPAYILIYFPKYTGSTLPYGIPGVLMPSKVVPIFPCRRYRTQNTTRTSTDD